MNARLFRIAWLRVMMKPLIRGLSSIFIRRSGMSATCCRFLAASSSFAQMPECPICLQVIHDAWRNVQKSMQSPAHVSPCCDMSWLCFWGHARSTESVLRTEPRIRCGHRAITSFVAARIELISSAAVFGRSMIVDQSPRQATASSKC